MFVSGWVGAAEGCDLLIFCLGFKCFWKDRSLVALDSSYRGRQLLSFINQSNLKINLTNI
ncbi:hypothetical protein SAMN03159443_03724 [Pseudomonas sp. NFACC15-1]|nr:hypothetical protein SAMN03159443_03724 [Pseudomonas sp. NFACC15-1]SDB58007.1 hypothetical protein SAMN03159290_04529 [Pseudomonas sp. NFACC13-1]SDW67709.1 hypothetical protein SAMN03159380_00971 [Pseudomonas sp. NFACC14]